MAVFLTGDTHAHLDFGKVWKFDGAGLTRDDYLIILGDFGLVWSDPASDEELLLLEWLEGRPWTTLFIDGNHENFDLLDALPVEVWHGGRIHRIREHILHLMRGEIFEIDGRTFFTIGGAYSIDAKMRTPHETWWPQEVPTREERAYIAHQVAKLESIDYVLTHCPPSGEYERFRCQSPFFWGTPDEWTAWLQEHVEGQFAYKKWFYGHLHVDYPLDDKHIALYNVVYDLDATGRTRFSSDMGTCADGTKHHFKMRLSPPGTESGETNIVYVCENCGKRVTIP